jgi:hypothetical protein
MMSKKKKNQRQHPRAPLDALVQVRSDSVEHFRQVHAKNVSVGGMFIAGSAARVVGAQVFFQFTVKDGGTLIEGLGKIVHASPNGIGIEFVSVLEPSASIIRALVNDRLKMPA